ncbi:hypothetical protein NST23_22650 [Brevibacillus sp. FSL K6-0770]|uniref:hypothetical protein n=1 Tax=Brevibacillus TaxID=55080 RepID=UPI0030F73F1A
MRISKIDNPTSGRFVLPQQRELYLQMKEDEKLVPMPSLEHDELESKICLGLIAKKREARISPLFLLGKIFLLYAACRLVPPIAAP